MDVQVLDTRRDVHPVRLRHAPVDPRRKHIGVTLVPLCEPQNPGVPQGHVSVSLNPHRHGHHPEQRQTHVRRHKKRHCNGHGGRQAGGFAPDITRAASRTRGLSCCQCVPPGVA